MKKTPLPSNLRSIPKGYVYLGRGNEFKRLPHDNHFLGYNMRKSDRFNESDRDGTKVALWYGVSDDSFYFAPVDSEIAKLNGLRQRKVASKTPKPEVKYIISASEPWAGTAYLKIENGKQSLVNLDGTVEDYAPDIPDRIKRGIWKYTDEKTALSRVKPPAPPAAQPPEYSRPKVKRGDIVQIQGYGHKFIVAEIAREKFLLVSITDGQRWNNDTFPLSYDGGEIPTFVCPQNYKIL